MSDEDGELEWPDESQIDIIGQNGGLAVNEDQTNRNIEHQSPP